MNRIGTLGKFAALLLSPVLLLWPLSLQAAPIVSQTFNLHPGWNAIYLEVQPEDNDPAAVFNDLPVESVWAWLDRVAPVEFLQDPAERMNQDDGWLAWFSPSTDAYLTNLFALQINQAYLVKLLGDTPQTLTVEGRPSLKQTPWVPNSLNLRGFPVDPAAPPTFSDFFAPSQAHRDLVVFRLGRHGQWQFVDNPQGSAMQSGEAYWVYCEGGSDYQGPVEVKVLAADGLSFGLELDQQQLELVNRRAVEVSVTVKPRDGQTVAALSRRQMNPAPDETVGPITWPTFSGAGVTRSLAAGGEAAETFAVKRQNLTGNSDGWVFEVTAPPGVRYLVPVEAERDYTPYAGLWVGQVEIDQVEWINAPDGSDSGLQSAPATMTLPLLLHVDTDRQVRLLKEVIQMWKDGTLNPDGSVATPGRYVLLTDHTKIPTYQGVALRDGVPVGRRLSSAAFDFSGTSLNCDGSLAAGATLTCGIVLAADHATNPFKHKFHPDHETGREITRTISLEFESSPPDYPDSPPPEWGYTMVGGSYSEEVAGLAAAPINTSGRFVLRLASEVSSLNQ